LRGSRNRVWEKRERKTKRNGKPTPEARMLMPQKYEKKERGEEKQKRKGKTSRTLGTIQGGEAEGGNKSNPSSAALQT